VALLATILAERLTARMNDSGVDPHAAAVDAYQDAYLIGAVLAFIGLVAAFFIHDEDAAASMSADAAQPEGH
jgi:hypothetical protein